MQSILKKIFSLYYDGFRSMTLGKTLWKIILIKLIIMFGVLKLFFFPNFLSTNFDTDEERAAHVLDNISQFSTNQSTTPISRSRAPQKRTEKAREVSEATKLKRLRLSE